MIIKRSLPGLHHVLARLLCGSLGFPLANNCPIHSVTQGDGHSSDGILPISRSCKQKTKQNTTTVAFCCLNPSQALPLWLDLPFDPLMVFTVGIGMQEVGDNSGVRYKLRGGVQSLKLWNFWSIRRFRRPHSRG